MNSLLTDTQQGEIRYVIKVNGVVRTAPLLKSVAEDQIKTLPLNEQAIAEVVPVTSAGQEILLG